MANKYDTLGLSRDLLEAGFETNVDCSTAPQNAGVGGVYPR